MAQEPLFIGRGDKSGVRPWILVAAALLVVGAGVVGLCVSGRNATIAGQTPEERIESISRLAAEQAPGAGKAIAGAASDDRDARVRCVALMALRKYARPETRGAIEQGTRDDVSKVRAAAAGTLGMYADAQAVERLGELLASDHADEVRLAAARGLARCNSRKADDLLVSAMRGNSSPVVQKRALTLLLEGTGVHLTPEPDPNNAAVWGRQVQKVLRHIQATRTSGTPGPQAGRKGKR